MLHEEPPPYTETALEGHVTLMYGTKPERQQCGDDARDVNLIDSSANSPVSDASQLFRRSNDALNISQNTELPEMDNVALCSSTPVADSRSPIMVTPRNRDPLFNFPQQNRERVVRTLFERPYQSTSMDTTSSNSPPPDSVPSSLPVSSSLPKVHVPSPFPPRLTMQQPLVPLISPCNSLEQHNLMVGRLTPYSSSSPPTCNEESDTLIRLMAPLDGARTFNNPFPRRPINLLPPLRSETFSVESSGQHVPRRRSRRRRGNSWHGETLNFPTNETPLLFNTTTDITTLVE